MPILAIIASVAQWFLGTKTGRCVLLGITALAAFGVYTFVIERNAAQKATAAIVDKEKAATDAESARRRKVLEDIQRRYATVTARLAEQEKRNAQQLQEIRRLSAAHDRERGLPADSVRRLRTLGADR